MRTMMICLGVLVSVGGCTVFGGEGEGKNSSPAAFLAWPTWEQVASFDPYDGAWSEHDSSGAEHVFIFEEAGTFDEDWRGGCCRQVGTWALTGDSLEIQYTDQSNVDLQFEVRMLSEGELHLAIMGRHGAVVQKFLPVPGQ
jgi:hypothetical protein